jgi:hypothetical protein
MAYSWIDDTVTAVKFTAAPKASFVETYEDGTLGATHTRRVEKGLLSTPL